VRVDQVAAERFLRERFGSTLEAVAPVPYQGMWSSAFAFARDGHRFVIRFTPYRDDIERDLVAARFASAELPVPEILETGEAFDGHYAVTRLVEGRHLDTLDERELRAALPSLLAAIAAMRRVDVSGFDRFGGWDSAGRGSHATWRGWLLAVREERVVRDLPPWRARMAASPTGTAMFERAFEVMTGLVDQCPEDRHLVHNDLLHLNVLVAGGRVTAVLDWGSSLLGDFLYDLAKFAFFAPWYPQWSAIDFEREGASFFSAAGPVPSFDLRMRCYQIHIGLEHQTWYASTGEWDNLGKAARRTLAIAATA
jgi:hygromycin-B 4-O-kinase